MAKMRATPKMPRGLRNRYRTRMMAAEGIFDEPSAKWSRFYAQYGWATPVVDEPQPAPQHAGPTRPELLQKAKDLGVELPSGYIKKEALVEMIEQATSDTSDDEES